MVQTPKLPRVPQGLGAMTHTMFFTIHHNVYCKLTLKMFAMGKKATVWLDMPQFKNNVYIWIKAYIKSLHHLKQLHLLRRLGLNCLIDMISFTTFYLLKLDVLIAYTFKGWNFFMKEYKKCLHFCIKDQWKSWERVNDDSIFIFWWTVPLMSLKLKPKYMILVT